MLKIKITDIHTCFKPYTYKIEINPNHWVPTIDFEINLNDLPKGLKIGDELELVKKETK